MSEAKISMPKLNGANWCTWKLRIESLLENEDLWDVVVKPVPAADKQNADWVSDNRHAKAKILLFLEDNQLRHVKDKKTAHEAFNSLKAHHEKSTRSAKVSLLKKLCSLNHTERGDVEQHLLKIEELFDRLAAAGMSLDEDTKICMLFRSLPESYDTLVTALDCLSDKEISVDLVRSKVLDENQRRAERESGSAPKGEKALRAAGGGKGRGPRLCHYCKKPGHLVANCWKKQKEEDDSDSEEKKKEKGSAKAVHSDQQGVAFVANTMKSSAWIIDSGASAHMCYDKSFFTSMKKFSGGYITLANGKKTQILGEGDGVLLGINGEENVQRIDVCDVKYVPGLATNLISVDCLAQKNLKVHFNSQGCRIIDSQNNVVATGAHHDGLYHLRLAESSLLAAGGHLENCQHQWHRRFGHRDWAAIERINKEELGTGVKVSDCGLRLQCECCMQGKAARAPFPAVTERKSTKVLDIVHTDVCGPIQTATPSGNRYVMHIIDDYSRFTVTYLMKHKSEAAQNIIDYVRWVENIFGRKPGSVRSDGGGEFDNKELRKFYKAEGIKPQYTTPYSPQSNGVAERKNRSITEMATCMLLDSGLEKRFWGEATMTATYLQNRLPSRSVAKTPYELWWGRKPDLSRVRVFGSEAYVHVPNVKRSKLDTKARKLTFVGYSANHKAYRFVDLETDQITISRDARFIELGNGTSSVEVSLETRKKKPNEDKAEDTILLRPFKEEESEDEFEDAEADSTLTEKPGRPVREIKQPTYLEDFVVGIAMCVVEESATKVWHDALEFNASLTEELCKLRHFLRTEVQRIEGVYKVPTKQIVEEVLVDFEKE